MTLAHVWFLIAFLGATAVVAGVALLAGGAWALVAGGLMAIVAAAVLVDPNEMRGKR